MKKVFLGMTILAVLAMPALAEEQMNPIITSMPSVSIAPDARSGAMGDIGAATAPDLNSQHWNPAKYAFMESQGGLTGNFTPWLSKLVQDIYLSYIAGYYTISEMAGTLSASFTYFSLGEVKLTDPNGNFLADAAPNEWALDLAYSRKLHEYVSMAVALRFLYSDMSNGVNASTMGGIEMYPGMTAAADVALYYRQPIELASGTSHFGLGLNISNLGGKISYDEKVTQHFIPANLRLGLSYEIPFDNYNSLSISADFNKYLVPTRYNKFAVDGNGNPLTGEALTNWYSELSSPRGWFMSFCDAPNGVKEEFQEIQFGVGAEYSYDKKFFARAGYSHESKWKGNRRYATVGAGFHLSIFSLDVAYVIGTAASNPLDQTLRFTLGFDLAGIKDLINNKK
ncbi:MAG: type IX secretion system outer membrane channel protein PorV [Paludibacteraceae bacterium]|nr:type IX secretion system outer membrane channel protein PorV [Paludibacteraceae bacterium]